MAQGDHAALAVTDEDIQAAAERLATHAHKTPVLTSSSLDRRTGSQVFFKCEPFQRTGSFKFRGAYNALSQLDPSQRSRGVIAYSSGNHGQALALAGQMLDTPVTIVMPTDAPTVKQTATRSYGAEVILYDRAQQTREAVTQDLIEQRGLTLIAPFDNPAVIAGQGTVAKELIDEVGDLDLLLVCVGGGGLISGCAIATKHRLPHCQVIGVEPKLADDATRSFLTGQLQRIDQTNTIADGARTACLGDLTFPIILQRVDDMVTVSDAAIARTMFDLWERLKIVVEPTGALAAAALLEGVISQPGARIGVILSGGNLDRAQIPKYLTKANPREKPATKLPLTWELS